MSEYENKTKKELIAELIHCENDQIEYEKEIKALQVENEELKTLCRAHRGKIYECGCGDYVYDGECLGCGGAGGLTEYKAYDLLQENKELKRQISSQEQIIISNLKDYEANYQALQAKIKNFKDNSKCAWKYFDNSLCPEAQDKITTLQKQVDVAMEALMKFDQFSKDVARCPVNAETMQMYSRVKQDLQQALSQLSETKTPEIGGDDE